MPDFPRPTARRSTRPLPRSFNPVLLIAALTGAVGFGAIARAAPADGSSEPQSEPLARFQVSDAFGVSHPDQILTFNIDAKLPAGDVHVRNESGEAVPSQLLDDGDRLALRTDLPANETRAWRLVQGAAEPALPEDAVQVRETNETYEIMNGKLGLRLARRPMTAEKKQPLAPIQGLRLADGTWVATGPNRLHTEVTVTDATVRLVERGPLRAVVEARYELAAATDHGLDRFIDEVDAEQNTLITKNRHYLERFKVTGRPVRFRFHDNASLPPLQANKQYYARLGKNRRTFQVSATPDGGPIDLEGPLKGDVEVRRTLEREGYYTQRIVIEAGQPSILMTEASDHDVSYRLNVYPGLKPDTGRYRGHRARSVQRGRLPSGERLQRGLKQATDAFVDLTYPEPDAERATAYWPLLTQWNPWARDTGWYWLLYNAQASDAANVVGMFHGRASRVRYAGHSGPRAFTRRLDDGTRAAGLDVQVQQRSPDTTRGPRVRFQWGLFLSDKASGLRAPDQTQPINQQMNLHAGINLNKIKDYRVEVPEPSRGYGAMFMPREAVKKIIQGIRADEAGRHGDGYYGRLYSAEPTARGLLEMWADESGERARQEFQKLRDHTRRMLDKLVNGDGIYANDVHYWHGGLAMSRRVAWIDQLLASAHLDARQKRRVEAVAALFGYILWDHDYVPLFEGHGLNLGTANMPVQQNSYRYMYALMLAQHPDFTPRAGRAVDTVRRMVRRTINEHGAHMGSSHYIHAAMGPLLNLLVQIKQTGLAAPFADWPRLRRFAEFYMQFVTPPNPRYDNQRLRLPTGDAEPNNPQQLAGVLGTAFADVDPELSARLMASWAQSGRPHSGFHVTTVLMIDPTLPREDPTLGSAAFPGYMTVLRNGWGQSHESAMWMLAGDWYRDHRAQETGMIAMHAHAAPLVDAWGPMYSPKASGSLIRSMLVPTDTPWRQVPAPRRKTGDWSSSRQIDFTARPRGGSAAARVRGFNTQWRRRVGLRQAGGDQPVFFVRDTFDDGPFVFSLAMTAQDRIALPNGAASVGDGFTLSAGATRLDVTGQVFEAHRADGIDWALFVAGDTAVEGFLTRWQHSNSGGQRQVILRLKGQSPYRLAIVPWPKEQPPASLNATLGDDGQLTVEVNGDVVRMR
jgi:hypothetical protein